MNQLVQERMAELGNDAPDVRVLGKRLYALEDLGDEAVSDLWYAFLPIPRLDPRQIAERRLRKADLGNGHFLLQAKPGLGLGQRDLPALIQVCQTRDDRAHEGAFLLGLLEIGD